MASDITSRLGCYEILNNKNIVVKYSYEEFKNLERRFREKAQELYKNKRKVIDAFRIFCARVIKY